MTTMTAGDVKTEETRPRGVFAALLAELRAEAEASYLALEEVQGARSDDDSTPAVGARASEEGERWTAREPFAEAKRPSLRRRNDRLQALKGHRVLLHRAPAETLSLPDLEPREESLATRCVRPSLRFLAHHDVVVMREGRSPGGSLRVELREPDATGDEPGATPAVELERVRVLKPASVVAHLQVLDLALSFTD